MSRHNPRGPQGALGEKAVDNQRLGSEGIVGGEEAEREEAAVRSASSSFLLNPPAYSVQPLDLRSSQETPWARRKRMGQGRRGAGLGSTSHFPSPWAQVAWDYTCCPQLAVPLKHGCGCRHCHLQAERLHGSYVGL